MLINWYSATQLLSRNLQASTLQFPTNITKMLKYGVNLLQVVGQFNGMQEFIE